LRFTRAFANAPLCTNTRVAIRPPIGLAEPLRYPQRNEDGTGITTGHPTLSEMLRRAGYRTALVGKWHQATCRGTAHQRQG